MNKIKWDDIKDKPREIDKLVAEHVFGYDITDRNVFFVPFYSKNIEFAWAIVEKLRNMDNIFYTTLHSDRGYFEFTIKDLDNNRIIKEEKTAPLAICHAALLAVGVLEE